MAVLKRRKKIPRVRGGIGTVIDYNGHLYVLTALTVDFDNQVSLRFVDKDSHISRATITGRDT